MKYPFTVRARMSVVSVSGKIPFDAYIINLRKVDLIMNREYDIIVAGGGMSGVAAAISAGRRGVKVLLVEQAAMLGGLGTAGAITFALGPAEHFGGVGLEIMDTLVRNGDIPPYKSPGAIPYENEAMKRGLEAAALEAKVDILMYAKIIGLNKKDGFLTELSLCGQEGIFQVKGKIFIDCTGDAMLAFYAGEPLDIGDENGDTQAPTLASCYAGIDHEKYQAFLKQYNDSNVPMIRDILPKAVAAGDVRVLDFHHPGMFKVDDRVSLLNVGHMYGADCLSPQGLTVATIEGRRQAKEYIDFYRKYIPGFENAYLVSSGSTLGIRETRRLVGKYVTTAKDKADFRKFEDAVLRMEGGSRSDVHASRPSEEDYLQYYDLFTNNNIIDTDDWATLPYRSFLPQITKNMLVAGRCLSADRTVQGQVRVMGYCFMMGQAVGTAAAIGIKDGRLPAEVNVAKLQEELEKDGIRTV